MFSSGPNGGGPLFRALDPFVHPLPIVEHDGELFAGDYTAGVVYRIKLKAQPARATT
jgi:hypothetical protein